MRIAVALVIVLALGSCGGRASGPISASCLTSGRSAANPALCSCIQGVADQMLSSSDQNRAADFFEDPDKAQVTRTSDNPLTENFWERYRRFADTAEAICG